MSHIVHTIEELKQLDPDTILIQCPEALDTPYMAFQYEMVSDYEIDPTSIFPMAVLRPGKQVRQLIENLEAPNG